MDDRHSIVRERQGYLGDPTSLLSRRKIKKSSTETWGDCHRHEFFEWKKHETALRKAFTDRGINGQMYAELCDECDKQLRTFRHLERDFARRSDLKKDSFFNLTRIKKITFGSAAFYKKLEDHVESLRSLNKALEAMRAVLDLEDPPTDLVNEQTLSHSEATDLESRALPTQNTAPVRNTRDKEALQSDPAVELLDTINHLLELVPTFYHSPEESYLGEPQFKYTADAFRRWDRLRRQRLNDRTVYTLGEIAWCLTSYIPDQDVRYHWEQILNEIYTRIGLPELDPTWETLTKDQFLPVFADLLKVLKVEGGLQPTSLRQSRTDLLGRPLSPPSSRDVSAGPSTKIAESPQTFPHWDPPKLLTLGQQQGKKPDSVNNLVIHNHYTEPGDEQNSTSYALSLSTPNILSTPNLLGGQLPKIPGLTAPALYQIAQDSSAVASSSGWTTTAKVGVGVGVPTALAGTVGAISSAANTVINQDSLIEAKAKNAQDRENKITELDMAKAKHDLEIAKLQHEKMVREREENERREKERERKEKEEKERDEKEREEKEQAAKAVAASLVGVSAPRHDPSNDEDDPFSQPPDNGLTSSEAPAISAIDTTSQSSNVEIGKLAQANHALSSTQRVVDTTDTADQSSSGFQHNQAQEPVVPGSSTDPMDDLYSDDSGDEHRRFLATSKAVDHRGRDTTTIFSKVAMTQNMNDYEMVNMPPSAKVLANTEVPQPVSSNTAPAEEEMSNPQLEDSQGSTRDESPETMNQDHSTLVDDKESLSQEAVEEVGMMLSGTDPLGLGGDEACPLPRALSVSEAQHQQNTGFPGEDALPGEFEDCVNAPL